MIFLVKALVHGHTSHTKEGKTYYVPEYSDQRTASSNPNRTVKEFPALPVDVARQCRLPVAPIRLTAGVQRSDHHGFGLQHIREQHGEEIKREGFQTEEEFVNHVLSNFNAVYDAGGGRYAFVVEKQGKPKVHILEVRKDRGRDSLSIVTGYVSDRGLPKHFRLMWRKLIKALYEMMKSHVRQYVRHGKSGMVLVREHDDRRTPKNALSDKATGHGWDADFPNIAIMTTGTKMKSHALYHQAKHGDIEAAAEVVTSIAKTQKLHELANRHPHAILCSVHEKSGDDINCLPQAYAAYIAHVTGLPVESDIVKTNKTGHTGSGAFHRFLSRAKFDGKVVRGKEYILCDDYVTQGGTLSELRQYIQKNGGKVVAITTLAAAQGSTVIAPTQDNLHKLEHIFGEEKIKRFLTEHNIYGGNWHALTNSEAGLLLKYRKQGLESARDKISAEAQKKVFAKAVENLCGRFAGQGASTITRLFLLRA